MRSCCVYTIYRVNIFAIFSPSHRTIIISFPTRSVAHTAIYVTLSVRHTVRYHTTGHWPVAVGWFCVYGSTSRHVTWPIWIVLEVDSGLASWRRVQMLTWEIIVQRHGMVNRPGSKFDQYLPPSAEVKNEWAKDLLPLYAFMAWAGQHCAFLEKRLPLWYWGLWWMVIGYRYIVWSFSWKHPVRLIVTWHQYRKKNSAVLTVQLQ
jgi:hypothetical protein